MKEKIKIFSGVENKNYHTLFSLQCSEDLNKNEEQQLSWLLGASAGGEKYLKSSDKNFVQYVGPNLKFETPESEKFRSICSSFGMKKIVRVEEFKAYFSDYAYDEVPFDEMQESVYTYLPSNLIKYSTPEVTKTIDLIGRGISILKEYNKKFGMGMDDFDLDYYYKLFVEKYKRNPTEVELMQIAQGNSEHCRHWKFQGKFIIDGIEMDTTLLQMAKDTLKTSPDGSVKAFNDNGGVLEGGLVYMFLPDENGIYRMIPRKMNKTATAETHNHPSMISPYPGAATGEGGMLRDAYSIGCGSFIGFGGIYFQTESIKNSTYILTEAIKGAADYGNAFGHPILLFGNDTPSIKLPNGQLFESRKPIIYVCATGSIPADAKDKIEAVPGLTIVRIGGATRRIGVGGGAASSMNAGENSAKLDFDSVQRGEPMMGSDVYKVVKRCISLGPKNPIESIHDQGAGGASNVITELLNPTGGKIDLAKINRGDESLSKTELWISESQELAGLLIKPENLEFFRRICDLFECPLEVLGKTDDSEKIVVIDSRDGSVPVDLTLPEILGKLPQKTYVDNTVKLQFDPFIIPGESISKYLENVAKVPGVALLNYMVDHFDGSVGGRVIQGPRVGEYMLPICNYAIQSDGFSGVSGSLATTTRSNPIAMLINEEATSRMMIAQMLMTNALVSVPKGIRKMKGRLNVMWPFGVDGMKSRLYKAYKAVTDGLKEIGFGLDGGKDSMSMSVNKDGEVIASFPTFIIESYAHLFDFRKRVTPELKNVKEDTDLILIELEKCKNRMGGSALGEFYGQTGDQVPDADLKKAKRLSQLIQYLVRKNKILAGSPKLKGGLLATVAKMAIASGVEVKIDSTNISTYDVDFYFNEEIGFIVQCDRKITKGILDLVKGNGLVASVIGHNTKSYKESFVFCYSNVTSFEPLDEVRKWFTSTGNLIKEGLLENKELITQEVFHKQRYKLTFNPDEAKSLPKDKKFRVAVLSAPGTNGEDELAYMSGRMKKQFKVQVVQMNQLISGEYDLKDFNVINFAGGFSYGDVGGSGKGWAASILFNKKLKKMFDDFYARPDTLSFGVCNGFQVATLLGLLDDSLLQKPRLLHNDSGIFEHRPVSLLIPKNTRAIMFKGMGGSILPAWSAHGEGKLLLPNSDYDWVEQSGLVSAFYADSNGNPTTDYGPNPNGSPHGIAGLCTENGRHVSMMPHPERLSASNNHLPYVPEDWKNIKNPVWAKAFENMYLWLYANVKQ